MTEGNLWKNNLIAVAYSYQQKAPPYLQLIETTERFITPQPGERWLDLGCGSGRLIESIWKKSQGKIGQIVGLDISLKGLLIAKRGIQKINNQSASNKVQFIQADIAKGLGTFRAHSFDGITAGLCLSYADHWNPVLQKWDKEAYKSVIRDLSVILKANGILVFSTNVPTPNFAMIALRSWKEILLTWRAPLHLIVSLVMLYQSRWLKLCAAVGRFHYLPAREVVEHLERSGFKCTGYELTYAGQAWVFSAIKKRQ